MANAVAILFKLERADVVFVPVYIVEVALKLYTYGYAAFMKKKWNMYVFVVKVQEKL